MMPHELQARLDAYPSLSRICVLGVDPGTMISSMTRLAPWFIRVLLFKVIYPLVLYLSLNGLVRSMSRSAGDSLDAMFGVDEEGNPLKDKYFNGRALLETSEESMDAVKREN
ncbi:hypothetical protein F5Y10DRAFT_287275 [Nemania abortiva]|nr:hypothetical protein F5Y10DRAFT_287275 [Nemania abortiva]